MVGLLDPGGQPVEHAHCRPGAFAEVGSDVELQGVKMPTVIGPENVSAARRLKPQGPVEERVVGAAQSDAYEGGAPLLGTPVPGAGAVVADQAAWPVLQLAVVAKFGKAGAWDDYGLSAAAGANDVDQVGVRGQGTATIEEPATGNAFGYHACDRDADTGDLFI